MQAEVPETEQRNLLAAAALNSSERKLYNLLSAEQPVHIDDIVERSGLNSSEVLATLFNLEMKGMVRQLPGKQYSKVLLKSKIGDCLCWGRPAATEEAHPRRALPHQKTGSWASRAVGKR